MGQQTEPSERDALVAFWDLKSRQAKRLVLRVEKRALFERIRSMYCSRWVVYNAKRPVVSRDALRNPL